MSTPLLVEIDSHPVAVNAFNYLRHQGMIHPGAVIDREQVEKALERLYQPGSWEFLGAFLLLKTKIEAEGFFITQSGIQPPGFKILDTEDMAEFAFKKLMKNLSSNFKISYIMAAHDINKLNDKQKVKHKCVQQQAAQTALMQQKMLLENSFF